MPTRFQTVFDLTSRAEMIQPAYWFIGIFVAAGIFLAGLAWLALRFRWRRRRYLTTLAIVWIALCTYIFFIDVRDTATIKGAVARGEIQTIEGCLDYFRPGLPYGTKTTAGNEEWSVQGFVFSYGAAEVRPAFHLVSTAGGPVRADSRVRVGYIMSPAYGRREIVKLEIVPHGCPVARESGTPAEP